MCIYIFIYMHDVFIHLGVHMYACTSVHLCLAPRRTPEDHALCLAPRHLATCLRYMQEITI